MVLVVVLGVVGGVGFWMLDVVGGYCWWVLVVVLGIGGGVGCCRWCWVLGSYHAVVAVLQECGGGNQPLLKCRQAKPSGDSLRFALIGQCLLMSAVGSK